MQIRKLVLLGLISVSLLSGCAWFKGDDDAFKPLPLPKVSNLFTAQQLWKVSVGSGIGKYYSHLHPTGQDNKIYAADRQGLVVAIDEDSGKPLWSVNLGKKKSLFAGSTDVKLSGGLTFANDKLFVGSEKAQVYALSAENGSLLWQTAVEGEVLSTPVINSGIVLIHTNNGSLEALDENTGKVKWTVNLDMPALTLRGESSPVIVDGAAVIGSNNGRLTAVLLNNGEILWQQLIALPKGGSEISRLNDVNTTPVVVNKTIYAVAYNGDFVAMDLYSGEIVWRRAIGSIHNFVVQQNVVYLVDQQDNILALNAKNGVTLWDQKLLEYRKLTAPVWYSDYLVVADSEGYLHWINPRDGEFASQQKVDSVGFLARPIVVDNNLIVQSKSGQIYAFKH